MRSARVIDVLEDLTVALALRAVCDVQRSVMDATPGIICNESDGDTSWRFLVDRASPRIHENASIPFCLLMISYFTMLSTEIVSMRPGIYCLSIVRDGFFSKHIHWR